MTRKQCYFKPSDVMPQAERIDKRKHDRIMHILPLSLIANNCFVMYEVFAIQFLG